MDTFFAPAERTERRIFKNQIRTVSHSPIVEVLLKTMAGLLIVLNEDRQVVALNHAFLDRLGIEDAADVLGLRLGEVLGCIHAAGKPHGCGTTPACRSCGAVVAMMAAITDNVIDEKVCALSSEKNGVKKELCLLVRAQPVVIDAHRWIMIFAQDITQQQFWVNLEQVFFHDINNMLMTLLANAQTLSKKMPDDRLVNEIAGMSRRLAGEMSLQQSLSQQKDGRYLLQKAVVGLIQLRQEVSRFILEHKACQQKELIEVWPEEDIQVQTDVLLASRVLGNMLINAFEATAESGCVRLTTTVENTSLRWEVWNAGMIAEEVQERIFQRHFSTKAKTGRGIGTYSMKLFGEKYLHGEVSFTSSAEEGTRFCFKLPCY